jgi:hypothetical protein
MTRRVSVAELITSITLLPVEAIAIVQQLIHGRAPVTLLAPLGPPTAETVFVGSDGSVTCDTCDAPFAVSDLATLLESMLPIVQSGNALSIGVPGALRYTLARARLEVDAPPFDSVGDFSRALARHECGDRTAVIQRVIGRANGTGAAVRLDRRRADPAVTQLRRQLRAADARVYDQQRAIDALSAMPTRVPAKGKGLALAAGVAIGLITFGAGQMMRHDLVEAAAAVIETPSAISEPARSPVVAEPTPPPAPVAPRASAPEARAPKRVLRNVSTPAHEAVRPGRFRWLKTRIVLRHDPL